MSSTLFSPIDIGPLRLPNRVVVAPMCQYSATDGCAGDWHLMHLGSLAVSGAGLLLLEATAVTPEGRISPRDLGLYNDANEAALRRVLDAVRAHSGMAIGVQLSHAGRKAASDLPWNGGRLLAPDAGGWWPEAPSPWPHGPDEPPPRELTGDDLVRIREAFVSAALRAARLGLQVVELHAAHGYLLHQFLSPLSNGRTDGYGTDLAGRLRFPLEVFDAVRAALPANIPVGVRVSAADWVEGGWDVEQTRAFAEALERRGCAYLHVSSGGVSPKQQIPLGPGYQVPLAEALKPHVRMPVIAVGLITEPQQAEAIVASGQADLVALARGLLYNPRWVWHAAAALGGQVEAPPQYWRCQPREYPNLFRGYAFGQR